LQAICALAASVSQHKEARLPSLVVCPSTLVHHWEAEMAKFVGKAVLHPLVFVGDDASREFVQAAGNDDETARASSSLPGDAVVIVGYDRLTRAALLFQSVEWRHVILDEGHVIRNPKSKVTRAVKGLQAHHRLILTGTPIQNNVSDLWCEHCFSRISCPLSGLSSTSSCLGFWGRTPSFGKSSPSLCALLPGCTSDTSAAI
jgi:TATA-binding protein-associated factor